MACNAILGALVARERSGFGQAVEVSLFDNVYINCGNDKIVRRLMAQVSELPDLA